MKPRFLILSGGIYLAFLHLARVGAQISFVNANNRLTNANFHSGVAMTVVDWNNDGLDDIVRMDNGYNVYVEVQKTNQNFQSIHLGNFGPFSGNGSAWAMAVADIDKNGYKDVVAGGYGPALKVLMTNNSGTGGTISTIPSSNFFVQNMTFADFNNDGWIDLFACDDNNMSKIFMNNNGTLILNNSIINFDVTNTDDSGNYGSAWTDYDNDGDLDLYIAKCRQGVTNPNDGRRINVLFRNNGNGTFTEAAAAANLNIGWQSWTASFGDIDNDGDFDVFITNHDHESQILQNDGNGVYTDISATAGVSTAGITPIQSHMADFDNDGWLDIIVTGGGHRLYRNNGNGTFSLINGLFNNNDMLTFAIGDLNHDGFQDIYSGYGEIYTTPTSTDDVVWLNEGNQNNFFVVDLQGTVSNPDAIGARAWIYGPWGVQTREVRSGESYGNVNSFMLHFGLGQFTTIDSLVIRWPSGMRQTVINPAINQFLTVIENTCVSPEALVTASGPLVICDNGSLTLTAPAGYNYLWSTGATTQSITVTQAGEYNVKVFSSADPLCFSISPTFVVEQSPDETPIITAAGPTEFCLGGSVVLSGPAGLSNYTWNTGETTASITVSTSGSYTLTYQGICQAWTSLPIQVTVNEAPAPQTVNDTISPGESATLIAYGNNVSWYYTMTDTSPFHIGNTYITPPLTVTTTYYVDDVAPFGGGIFSGGMPKHTGNSHYSGSNNTNALMYFDVFKPCTLKTVKVYTDIAGTRNIVLLNNQGQLIHNTVVNVQPDSQIITLNWVLNPGSDYAITTDTSYNQLIPGWNANGPRFKRNSSGVSYPYLIQDILTITNSSFGPQYYYYFYDWQVEIAPEMCSSQRVPVTAEVKPSVSLPESENGLLKVYPNPASDEFFVRLKSGESLQRMEMRDLSGRLVRVINSGPQQANLRVSTNGLAPGFYIIQVTTLAGLNDEARVLLR
ncbi:MAG: FG-GAP-like repeat-containing protein [Flavobacteriales bacterium]|nr:FG-GAP-like repeat-containing protein [Flavobacteriales bacterium]MCX7768211.1 FG-GAP-like repeat-containing protein [Flavobacteriales bacterium]MDW8409162.1 FG-GAP-like repeat-containing protein [Flavobacteriales bacterium]